MFDRLRAADFEVETVSHAHAILMGDFPEVVGEVEGVLVDLMIPISEIIGSGGGETKATQRLRRAFVDLGWKKHNFVVERVIDGKPFESRSHEIDHIKAFENGRIALEIEWNNKDPFFDRDLENFKRLHADGAISVGIVVTRGASLQDEMMAKVAKYADANHIDGHDDVRRIGLDPTRRQRNAVQARMGRTKDPLSFRQAWVEVFVRDKFGTATTHWRKLEDRIRRGVGNPCPLVLIGLPASIVVPEA